jgi:hypothetical protein
MKVNSAGLFSLAHSAPEHAAVGEEVEVVIDEGPPPPPRTRKTTLETFNDEMAVMDRPLEGEEEFYDEPRPRRWRVPAIGAAIFALSCGAYLGLARHRGVADAATVATAPAPPSARAAVAAAPAPEPAAAPAAAPAPGEAAAAPTAAAPSPAPIVADDSRGEHHHRGRHGGERHHHHHGGHGHHARG